ncbi:MAG: TM2 domain-containing protein [Ruminococcus sp.]|nr:TM2 domain-containing protein [Ruminococcus sp.]
MDLRKKTTSCPHCKATISSDAVLCTYCGQQVKDINPARTGVLDPSPMVFCRYCGNKMPENAPVCTACGRKVDNFSSNQNNMIPAERTIYCQGCGNAMPESSNTCSACGRPVIHYGNNSGRTIFCQHCGNQMPDDAVICTSCGRELRPYSSRSYGMPQVIINNQNISNDYMNNAAGSKPKRKWTAFTLCLLFGYTGVHKFYEEKTALGVLYLLTFGLFGIGWLADCVMLLFKSDPYYV